MNEQSNQRPSEVDIDNNYKDSWPEPYINEPNLVHDALHERYLETKGDTEHDSQPGLKHIDIAAGAREQAMRVITNLRALPGVVIGSTVEFNHAVSPDRLTLNAEQDMHDDLADAAADEYSRLKDVKNRVLSGDLQGDTDRVTTDSNIPRHQLN